MSALDTYLQAVSERKAISRKTPSPMVNYAIASQLEDNDVPLLIEIVRAQNEALNLVAGNEVGGPMSANARRDLERIEQLAAKGSTSRWGEEKAAS